MINLLKRTLPRVLACVAVLTVFAIAAPARAAAVPIQINMVALRAVQTYALEENAEDEVYLLLSGIAKGEEFQRRVPEQGTLPAAPKKPPVDEEADPLELWQGELADGEFVMLTVTLMHGKGADEAKTKEFLEKKAAGETKVAERAKKTLTADDFKNLTANTLTAHRELITGIKDIFSRDKNTDHYGGQFTITVWNNNGTPVKRLDPVGLTFGEHYGKDVKVYTKLKQTLSNVMYKEANGQWFNTHYLPLSDDKDLVRVKMLETEYVGEQKIRNVTDYLTDIEILGAGDEPLLWKLGGEVFGPGPVHTYYNFAE